MAIPHLGPALFGVGVMAIIGVFVALPWWRRYFRRLFEARFQPQEDGSYLANWTPRRGQPVEVYRIDAVAKERVLAFLIDGSVVGTGLFVVLLVAAVVINVIWPTPLMIPGMLLLAIVAFAPQRRASRQAGDLIVMGSRVDGAEGMSPPAPSPEASARSLRAIILLSCAIVVMGAAIGVIFYLDPDSGTIAWTDGASLAFLLVLLPLSVALFNWWALRRTRS